MYIAPGYHGPAAGTPDKVGGNSPLKVDRLLAHYEPDVKQLDIALNGTGGMRNPKADLRSIAPLEQIPFGLLSTAGSRSDYKRRIAAIAGWRKIQEYQNSKGGFYKPCVPANAPENWGPWEFDSDGTLRYTDPMPVNPVEKSAWRSEGHWDIFDPYGPIHKIGS
jgi:hypothetical protein